MHFDLLTGASSRAITIHLVRPADLPELMRLRAEQAGRDQGDRYAFGGGRADDIELREALFESPARAWAWLARFEGRAVGYACASAGFSVPERAYYLRLEDLYARDPGHDAELALVRKLSTVAGEMGCANLQWRFPAGHPLAARIAMYTGATRLETVSYVLPVTAESAAVD